MDGLEYSTQVRILEFPKHLLYRGLIAKCEFHILLKQQIGLVNNLLKKSTLVIWGKEGNDGASKPPDLRNKKLVQLNKPNHTYLFQRQMFFGSFPLSSLCQNNIHHHLQGKKHHD